MQNYPVKKTIIIALAAIFMLMSLSLHTHRVYASQTYTAEDYADILLDDMSTNRKCAQLMLVSVPSSHPAKTQKTYQYGGYLLFARDFKGSTKSKFKSKVKLWQKKSNVGMLIAVDEEGGTVVRASLYNQFRKSKFRSPRKLYKSGGYSKVVSDTKKKDAFLKKLGINCNLAPVADVPYKSSNFIYDRAFSTSTKRTTKGIGKIVAQMKKDKMISTLKHFPGYGGNGDTHGNIIRDKRSLKKFKNRDLKPFQKGIDKGADMIMVSHIIVNAFDKKKPASISKKVHTYLREKMGFEGVIITDAIGMQGLQKYVQGDSGEAAVRAILAGNDMICVTADRSDVYKSLKKAVKKGRISKKRLNKSVRRILIMKIKKGIIKIPK